MSATSFRSPDVAATLTLDKSQRIQHWLRRPAVIDTSLAVFASAMLIAMILMPGQETIPYHFMFLSVTLVYGFRVWPMKPTLFVIGAITTLTGLVLGLHCMNGDIEPPELAEVPLMPMLLVAMVWHARRRADAQQQLQEMADERHRSLEREREFLRDASH